MPVIDNEPPSDALPPGSYWAKTSVPFEYPEEAGQGVEWDPVEIIQAIASWLIPAGPNVKHRTSPQRAGVKLFAVLWVMHPDRMPWAIGITLSEADVAKKLGIERRTFMRAVSQVSEQFGMRHAFQGHAWNRKERTEKAIAADEAAAKERRAELIAARKKRKRA